MNNYNLKRLFKKILFFLIITIILWFIKLNFVSAATIKVKLSDLTYDNSNLLDLKWYYKAAGNKNIFFDYDFASLDENTNVLYNSLVLCSSAKYTSAYASDPSEVVNIQMNNTNYTCAYSNSSAIGNVVIITFVTYSSGANSIVVYQDDTSSVQLLDFVVDSSSYVNPLDYSNQTLINQNSQIINQNQTIINNGTVTNDKLDATNGKLDDLNKNLTDESSPNLNGLENSAGWLKSGPVDSIINLPLTLLNNLQTNLGNTCNPVTVKLPYVNKDINLPCISAIYKQINGLDTWFQGIGIIAAAFILYRYFMYLYNRIDDTLSFRENNMQGYFDDSLWGGM